MLGRKLTACLALLLAVGCDGAPPPPAVAPIAPAAAYEVGIDLQDGFTGGSQVTITIDGRQVYTGQPATDERLGLADHFQATSATRRPVVAVTVPAQKVSWTQTVDLTRGHVLGISLTADKQVRLLQQTTGFGYE